MRELEYPFDIDSLIKNKKKIKKELLKKEGLIDKKIAVLGGSTTSEIINMLELFLLNYGIKPTFYESEYNKYYEDAMFGNKELDAFKPDIIFIHTTNRNIIEYPNILDDEKTVDSLLKGEITKFSKMWDKLASKFNCTIIQNNFEYPFYRLLGNKDAVDIHGRVNFITRLNQEFYDYANSHENFFINDINYISSCYGLDKWADQFYWHMYKYALEVPAIPYLAHNLANIIKSIYGKNKKAFVLDMDNTLWGGIVGDDGVENLAIGPEVPSGQVFAEFQEYLKQHKNLGVILNIDSKNEHENAIAGLEHPAGVLKPDDFIIIKANWNPKNLNIKDIAEELNLGADSFVFVDDNPAERKIVKEYVDGIATPEIDTPENYIRIIDHNGYFEMTNFSKEDLKKNELYKDNAKRSQMMATFDDYDDYLKSLKMKAEITEFK
ncbi:MAG: HAD-IIIC family phosphatase, partial [Bacilli bacterium]|nr:HAD-IIIC family phosphatase [Bacilli bacterium]